MKQNGIAFLIILATSFSVVYDLHTYEERRKKGERLTRGGHR